MTTPEFLTPALVVDLDAFDANLKAAEKLVGGTGKLLRPHFKTHRTPELALRQLGPAATGITCATVGEASVLVEAGVRDVLIANEVVTPAKLDTLARLALKARITVAVDAPEALRSLAQAAQRVGASIDVLIDQDIGLNRCGVRTIHDACALAALVAQMSGVQLTGIMGYEGRVRSSASERADAITSAYTQLAETKAALEGAGQTVRVVSSAGTSTLREALADPVITEIQAGTYALMEPDIEDLGLPFCPAAYVIGTVISRTQGRVVLDTGRRSITSDHGLPLCLDPRGQVVALNDEHAVLAWTNDLPELGAQVRLRPTQNRTTFNLHDKVWVARGDQIIDQWPITARGKS